MGTGGIVNSWLERSLELHFDISSILQHAQPWRWDTTFCYDDTETKSCKVNTRTAALCGERELATYTSLHIYMGRTANAIVERYDDGDY